MTVNAVSHRAGAKGLIAFTVLVGVVLTALFLPSPATADSLSDREQAVDAQIADLRESLNGASKSLVEAAVEVKRTQVALVEAGQTRAAAQLLLRSAQRHDAELASRLVITQAQERKATRELATVQMSERATRRKLGVLVRRTYVGGTFNGLAVALQTTSPAQFTDRMTAAGAVFRAQSRMINRFSVQQVDVRSRQERLSALQEHVIDLKRQSATMVLQRQTAQGAATHAEQRVSTLMFRSKAAQAVIQGNVAAERRRVNALEAEQSKLQTMLRARATASEAARRRRDRRSHVPRNDRNDRDSPEGTRNPSGVLSWPARGPITSPFGRRFHPILKTWRLHSGIDLGLPCGTPVRAATDGRVISAGSAGGYGNRVVIDHGRVNGGNLVTDYNHLQSIVVRRGVVRRGQLIAYSGTTGLSTGCHLHFDTLINSQYTDPLRWL